MMRFDSRTLCVAVAFLAATRALPAQTQRVDVRLVTDEAEAVLALVERGEHAQPGDWERLFTSEGYQRLKQRESAMQRPFTDDEFRAFVLDTALRRRAPELRRTLAQWKHVQMDAAASRAFVYLPAGARIRATIYPSIKPKTNTFVWEAATNPAIFFYIDPATTAARFENTLAHELHHLGVASICNNDNDPLAVQWMGGFAEGRAMLAAAGSPDLHPHETSPAAERAVWDRDYASVATDIPRLERFFSDLMSGTLSEAQQRERGFGFVATDSVPQGAFYTVGYHMARAVEKDLGRAQLVASTCDPVQFLRDYQIIAKKGGLPQWSDAFIARLER